MVTATATGGGVGDEHEAAGGGGGYPTTGAHAAEVLGGGVLCEIEVAEGGGAVDEQIGGAGELWRTQRPVLRERNGGGFIASEAIGQPDSSPLRDG